MENNQIESNTDIDVKTIAKKGGRKGRGAKEKSQLAFRTRRAKQDSEAFDREIAAKYKLFDADEGSLKSTLESVKVKKTPVAKPLTVSTRGVGVATALTYERTCTTWNARAIGEIVSINQVYRIHLLCVHAKLFRAQQCQVEGVSVLGALARVVMNGEVRDAIETIGQLPSSVVAILDAVGRIEAEGRVFHMGYASFECPTEDTDLEEFAEVEALSLNPQTIRNLLERLANPATPLVWRRKFIEMNSIPGAIFHNDVLLNPDDVWPAEYEMPTILADIHAYKNWVTRVEGRLPRHMFPKFEWSGKATTAGLISCEPVELKMVIRVTETRVERQTARQAGGSRRILPAYTMRAFESAVVSSPKTDFWSLLDTPEIADVIGVASLVGEVHCSIMRQAANAHFTFSANPVMVALAICDAPK